MIYMTTIEKGKKIVLINGLPATGKSMLGERLRQDFNAPLLSLDSIKEALFDVLGIGDREYNRKLGRATKEVIWTVINELPHGMLVFVDAWLGFPPYDTLITGLNRADASKIIEIWCHAPGNILAQRYIERVDIRHKGHLGKEYATELSEIADRVKATGLFPSYLVDTTQPENIDIQKITYWIESEMGILLS